MNIGADHVMGGGRRPGDPALDLRGRDPLGHDRERLRGLVSGLHFDRGPVDGGAIQTRRRPGLQPSKCEAGALEGRGKTRRRRLTDTAGGPVLLAEMDKTAEEGAGGDDDSPGPEHPTVCQAQSGDPAIGHDQVVGLALDD